MLLQKGFLLLTKFIKVFILIFSIQMKKFLKSKTMAQKELIPLKFLQLALHSQVTNQLSGQVLLDVVQFEYYVNQDHREPPIRQHHYANLSIKGFHQLLPN